MTIITVPAADRLAWLHERMPALLPDAEAADRWLSGPGEPAALVEKAREEGVYASRRLPLAPPPRARVPAPLTLPPALRAPPHPTTSIHRSSAAPTRART